MILQFSQSFLTDARTFIFFFLLKRSGPSKSRKATFANSLCRRASGLRLPAAAASIHAPATGARSPVPPDTTSPLATLESVCPQGGWHLLPARKMSKKSSVSEKRNAEHRQRLLGVQQVFRQSLSALSAQRSDTPKYVAAGILPASEGRLPAARRRFQESGTLENFDVTFTVRLFSAGLEATAHGQARMPAATRNQ